MTVLFMQKNGFDIFAKRESCSSFIAKKTGRWCFYRVAYVKNDKYLYQSLLSVDEWKKLRGSIRVAAIGGEGGEYLEKWIQQESRKAMC